MKKHKKSVFTIIMCAILAICVSLSACNFVTGPTGGEKDDKQDVSLTDQSGVVVSGKFESGAQLSLNK